MLGFRLISALLGLGPLAGAAPVATITNAIDGCYPPSRIPIIFETSAICIIAPPTNTIGPTTKRDDGSNYPSRCMPLVLEEWNICIVAPPTSIIGPSTERRDEVDPDPDLNFINPSTSSISGGANDDDDNDPDPRPTVLLNCIPSVYEKFKICIAPPPTSTIGPSSNNKHRRDWFGLGSVTVGALVPNEAVPGGAITPNRIVPGGAITPSS